MAVAYITGLQSQQRRRDGKHFVGNDSEFERNTISSDIDERTLREIYLPPFEAAVHEAGTWAVMSAYNRVNGTYVGEHRELLTGHPQAANGGSTASSCPTGSARKSTVDAANNGLDLEMPGPPHWRGERLLAAVEAGAGQRDGDRRSGPPDAPPDRSRRRVRAT